MYNDFIELAHKLRSDSDAKQREANAATNPHERLMLMGEAIGILQAAVAILNRLKANETTQV